MKGIKGLLASLTLCLLAACNQNTKVDDNLYRIMVGEKYGFMDASGKIVIEPQFDDANELFSEGVCFVKTENRRGLIDKTGVFIVVLPDTVEYVGEFKGGLSRASNGMDRGVINKNGELIIPLIYDNSEVNIDIDSVFAFAWNVYGDNEWIIVDQNGFIIDSRKKESALGFENGMCRVHIKDKWGYLNKYGNLVIDTLYDYAYDFTEDGVAQVEKDNEYLFIDINGKCLFKADSILSDMVCNRAAIMINGEKFLVDKVGNKICPITADGISEFSIIDKTATIRRNGRASLIDTMGNIVLSSNYEWIAPFVGGIAAVEGKDGCGFIDIHGNSVIGATNNDILDELYDEKYKLRAVWNKENNVWCLSYYDLQGNLIWKDIPRRSKKTIEYYNADREDFIEYFDANIAELDPIEGIYYVTDKHFYQDRNNLNNIGQNDTESKFCAITFDEFTNGFRVDYLDDSNQYWVNKFVKIGNSNSYAIQKIDKDNDYSKEGRVSINDFNNFDFRLDLGHNNYYNFFATYEFVRDYPTVTEMEKFQRAEWTGSGFAIADGYIVTNYHVTNGAKTIRIKGVNGDMEEAYKGFVVASDKEHDLSIVKIVDKDFEGFDAIPYKIGKTTVDVGDDIFVLGYPMTQTMGEEVKLTNGVISAASGYKGDASMYQISAAVQSGNSGGPLFNEDGAVIGVVCAKHAGAENANYAVKVSYLYSLITSSNLGIDISGNDKVKGKSLSKQVKKIKDFVYLIECSSK